MATKQDRMALLSRYAKLHTKFYEEKVSHNLNVEQWAADMLIESYGIQECYTLLDYYFETAPNPNWKYFANYADHIIYKIKEYQKDLIEREERRKKAKDWLNE